MENGLYAIKFETQTCYGSGIALISDGRFRGGDGALFFDGTISAANNIVRAEIETGRHVFTEPPSPTIFGTDVAHLLLEGRGGPTQAIVDGPVTECPALSFRMLLSKLRD